MTRTCTTWEGGAWLKCEVWARIFVMGPQFKTSAPLSTNENRQPGNPNALTFLLNVTYPIHHTFNPAAKATQRIRCLYPLACILDVLKGALSSLPLLEYNHIACPFPAPLAEVDSKKVKHQTECKLGE